MALTPKQVTDELAKTGRRVTERQLTDWRARELLPELSEKGEGQGKGKIYFWTQPDILERVAFVADHKGWDTSRVIFVLWCCGFEVPQKALKEAWLEAQDYFDELEDAFHQHAAAFEKLKRAEGDDMAQFAYEAVQVVFAFVFANAIQNDVDVEIDYINQYLKTYKPMIGEYREYGLPIINVEVALSMRRFVNVFAMRDAIRKATPTQIAEAEFIWRTICRLPALVSQARSPELGLTWARRLQATFGRPVLSSLMVALRTKGEAPFVRLFEAVSELLDKLEAAKEGRAGIEPEDLGRISPEIALDFLPTIVTLWHEFIEGVRDGAPNI
jgi:hypothetical protein